MERLKFTAIAGANLDEFFMVRVAEIHQQLKAGVTTRSPDGLTPRETIGEIRRRTHGMLRRVEHSLNGALGEPGELGVRFLRVQDLDESSQARLRGHYLSQIHPVLTPLAVDPSHPFPYLSNLSLNLAVTLLDEDGEEPDFARVKVPVGVLPRVVPFGEGYLLLEDVLAAHLHELFTRRTVLTCHLFRVTRNTDYAFEEEEADDLLRTIEEGLRRRRFGDPVRLEVNPGIPPELRAFLADELDLDPSDVFELDGPLGVADFLAFDPNRPDLHFPPFTPHVPDVEGERGVFATLGEHDLLLHHPYDGFEDVLTFLEAATTDPDVLAIKMTLSRTGNDERLLTALRTAAELGKQVVALIELKARFDEQRNILWARHLEQAGVHVVYGIAGLKTHAKVTLVVRREAGELRRYVHVGTGNHNPRTARLYTDLSLLTTDPRVGSDATRLFNALTGYADETYDVLLVAPDFARARLVELIKAEVDVRLMVRGVCTLRPGAPGLSERIQVRSLLGRFLEHARVYAFGGSGVYFGSADLMTRNLSRRQLSQAPRHLQRAGGLHGVT